MSNVARTPHLLPVVDAEKPAAAHALKPAVDPATLVHRDLVRGEFWRKIPAYAEVTEAQFLDHNWQAKHSVTRIDKLLAAVKGIADDSFVKDAEEGFKKAPMSVRISPYMLALIDWSDPYRDPIRTQFLPLATKLFEDHPKLDLDSLHEQADAPVPGLTHRYHDKALFLPLDTCPVYCRFCTRSYAVGVDTEEVEKVSLKANEERWQQAYTYIRSRVELEDIVISGGDAYQLRAQQLEDIGMALLDMPNVRRMRFATKGPAVMPQKILTDVAWTDALTRVVERGRKLHKEVVLHTHFNHPNEITAFHIVRRMADNDVRLLANQLPFVKPGALKAAMDGRAEWPYPVFKLYWPLSRSDSFQPTRSDSFQPARSDGVQPGMVDRLASATDTSAVA